MDEIPERPRGYINAPLRTYTFFSYEHFEISNQELLNKIIKIDFAFKGLDADLEKIFGNYQEVSVKFLGGDHVKGVVRF